MKGYFALLRLLVLALVIGSLMVITSPLASAQCGCSCAMVCNNACEFECSGCGLLQGAEVAAQCCQGARQATGDTGPCTASSSV